MDLWTDNQFRVRRLFSGVSTKQGNFRCSLKVNSQRTYVTRTHKIDGSVKSLVNSLLLKYTADGTLFANCVRRTLVAEDFEQHWQQRSEYNNASLSYAQVKITKRVCQYIVRVQLLINAAYTTRHFCVQFSVSSNIYLSLTDRVLNMKITYFYQ